MHYLAAIVPRQRRESELADVRVTNPRRPIRWSVRRHEEHWRAWHGLDDRSKKFFGGLVDPMEILDNQHDRVFALENDASYDLEGLALHRLGAEGRCGVVR